MRYYDPTTGRFTQQDSLEVLADPARGNRYQYAGSNPVNYVDPTGRDYSWEELVGDIAGAIVTTAITLLGTALAPGIGTYVGLVVGGCVGGTISDGITSDLQGEDQSASSAGYSCLGGAITAGIGG